VFEELWVYRGVWGSKGGSRRQLRCKRKKGRSRMGQGRCAGVVGPVRGTHRGDEKPEMVRMDSAWGGDRTGGKKEI